MAREGKAPAFQFYAADWLADIHVRAMTPAERGIYIDLLAYCWREGKIPTSPNLLARIVAIPTAEMERVWKTLRPRFLKNGRHARLDAERDAQDDYRAGQAEAGKRGAAKRWGRHSDPIEPDRVAIVSPMAKNSSASASASATTIATADHRGEPPAEAVALLLMESSVTGVPWMREQVDGALRRSGKTVTEFLAWIRANRGTGGPVDGQDSKSVCTAFAPVNGATYKAPGQKLETPEEFKARMQRRKDR